jgi:hypothetical protein
LKHNDDQSGRQPYHNTTHTGNSNNQPNEGRSGNNQPNEGWSAMVNHNHEWWAMGNGGPSFSVQRKKAQELPLLKYWNLIL